MRLSILLILGILISNISLGQIDSTNFSNFSIAKISPAIFKELVYIDSTDSFTFQDREHNYTIINKDSLDLTRLNNELQLKNSDWEKIKAILKPSQKELNKLKDREVADCYIPRHAIVFYDENNEVLELIEICFECHAVRTFGKCNLWEINITPNGFKKLKSIYEKHNLIE